MTPKRKMAMLGGALLGAAALAVLASEKRWPLRRPRANEPGRSARNVALGVMSLAVISLVERPITQPLAERARRDRRGLAQWLPAPAWAQDALAVLLMDYTIYLWHIATHKVPVLWRFHVVHHVDLDLDATSALRFHAADMAISAPFRAAQISLLGVSPRAFRIWQTWFFLAVWFHHSNLALPRHWDRRLARLVTTPRMHGIHHSTVRDETASNWSSGLALWDHLHGTFRFDVPPDAIAIGVPGYREELGVRALLALPLVGQRDAWTPPPKGTSVPLERFDGHGSREIAG